MNPMLTLTKLMKPFQRNTGHIGNSANTFHTVENCKYLCLPLFYYKLMIEVFPRQKRHQVCLHNTGTR